MKKHFVLFELFVEHIIFFLYRRMVSFGFFFFVVFFVWAWYFLLLGGATNKRVWQHKGKDQERAICKFVAVKKRPRMFFS